MDDLEKFFLGKVGWDKISPLERDVIPWKFAEFMDINDWENRTEQERERMKSDYIKSVRADRRMRENMLGT